jgi:hypothetical protein
VWRFSQSPPLSTCQVHCVFSRCGPSECAVKAIGIKAADIAVVKRKLLVNLGESYSSVEAHCIVLEVAYPKCSFRECLDRPSFCIRSHRIGGVRFCAA